MLASGLLVCLALGAIEARADNTADEADIAFALGNKHYSRREYEPALSQYFLSYRLVPNRNVLFNIAHCYEALNRFDEAYRYYYDLSVDAAGSEADRKDIRVALTRLGPRVALVSVTSEPSGAEIFVDREDHQMRFMRVILVREDQFSRLDSARGHDR